MLPFPCHNQAMKRKRPFPTVLSFLPVVSVNPTYTITVLHLMYFDISKKSPSQKNKKERTRKRILPKPDGKEISGCLSTRDGPEGLFATRVETLK